MSFWDEVKSKVLDQSAAERSAAKQRKFIREQMQNRFQWTAQDMEKAGLNRILAAGGNPPVVGGTHTSATGTDFTKAKATAAQKAQTEQNTQLLETQEASTAQDLRYKKAKNDYLLDPKNKEVFDAAMKKEAGISAPVKDTQFVIDSITKYLDNRETSTVSDLIKAGAYTAVGAILLKKLGLVRAMMSLKNLPKNISDKIRKGMQEKQTKGKPRDAKMKGFD